MDDLKDVNTKLEQLSSTLELAGLRSVVVDLCGRDRVVEKLSTWYCLGRTRPAFERWWFICSFLFVLSLLFTSLIVAAVFNLKQKFHPFIILSRVILKLDVVYQNLLHRGVYIAVSR